MLLFDAKHEKMTEKVYPTVMQSTVGNILKAVS